jgi:purine-binding chemotaxis protein CheW
MQNQSSAAHSDHGNKAGGLSQFATFRVGDLVFGIDVMKVQEVIRYQEMTPVPLSSHVVEGLINLRWQIIKSVDMRRLQTLPDRDNVRFNMNDVVRTAE